LARELGVWKAEDCAVVPIDYQPTMMNVIRSETNADLVEPHAAAPLSTPSLALFLVSGGLIGAGAVFKGTTGLVLAAAAPENRVALTAELLIALFVGLSVPVIGAGIALEQGASVENTVLGFALLVRLGVAGAGWGLLGRRPKTSPQAA
jgi:hypothetical protein